VFSSLLAVKKLLGLRILYQTVVFFTESPQYESNSSMRKSLCTGKPSHVRTKVPRKDAPMLRRVQQQRSIPV
jgi:hypothetical protein